MFATNERDEASIRHSLAMARAQVTALEKQLRPDSPTTMEKLSTYEGLLHDIQMFAEVVLDAESTRKLIHNICSWSYAHRCGNGEFSEEEQQEIIDRAFRKLRDR